MLIKVVIVVVFKFVIVIVIAIIIAYIVSIAINTIFEQIFILFVFEQPTLILVNLDGNHFHLRIPFLFLRG